MYKLSFELQEEPLSLREASVRGCTAQQSRIEHSPLAEASYLTVTEVLPSHEIDCPSTDRASREATISSVGVLGVDLALYMFVCVESGG
jgi:hypothetical protein